MDHGWITADRGQAGGGQVLDGRRGGNVDAGVQDDRVPARTHRGTHRGAGRAVIPGTGTRRSRLPSRRFRGISLMRGRVPDRVFVPVRDPSWRRGPVIAAPGGHDRLYTDRDLVPLEPLVRLHPTAIEVNTDDRTPSRAPAGPCRTHWRRQPYGLRGQEAPQAYGQEEAPQAAAQDPGPAPPSRQVGHTRAERWDR